MASTLVDSPPAPETEPQAERGPARAGPVGPAGSAGPEQPVREPAKAVPVGPACAKCGVPLAAGQDWCLHCGSGVQGGSAGSGWRPAATMLAATAALVLGAAAAGYAALSKSAPKQAVRTATVAQAPPVATTPPLGTPETIGPLPETGTTVEPPKIPLTAQTPTTATPTTGETGGSGTESESTKKQEEEDAGKTGGASGETKPKPILLDTNAASTYNPYNYPSTLFGDPSLTIDGDTTTSWTAQLNPETAPRLAEGVLIDLNTARKLSAMSLVTSSLGMTVQVYGAVGHTVPASITEPAWVTISHAIVVKKHRIKIKLKDQRKGFDFVTLWISRAGEKSVGTATAPGHVSVGEVELFPKG